MERFAPERANLGAQCLALVDRCGIANEANRLSPHHFPRITDTFIRREIRSLQKLGTDVRVISVWKPTQFEMPDIVTKRLQHTQFALPRSTFSIALIMLTVATRSPIRFVATVNYKL